MKCLTVASSPDISRVVSYSMPLLLDSLAASCYIYVQYCNVCTLALISRLSISHVGSRVPYLISDRGYRQDHRVIDEALGEKVDSCLRFRGCTRGAGGKYPDLEMMHTMMMSDDDVLF